MLPFLCAFAAGFLLAWAGGALELIPWRRTVRAGAHWTEQARVLYPSRVARVVGVFLGPLAITALAMAVSGNLDWLPAIVIGSVLGAIAAGYPLDRELYPGLRPGRWALLTLVSFVVYLFRWGVVTAAMVFMPNDFGPVVWLIAAGVLVVQVAWQFGLTFRLLRGLGLMRPAGPRVQGIVRETCARMGVTTPPVWELALLQANAMAAVHTRELVFTDPLLAETPDDEVAAICAHEMGHLNEEKPVLLGRFAGALAGLPLVLIKPVARHYGPAAVGLVVLTLVIVVASRRLAHAMEKRADRIAVESTTEKAVYARALERIYRINRMPAAMRRRGHRVHPDLYDRMLAAGVTPDYPRPAPPPGRSWSVIALSLLCAGSALYLVLAQ